MGTTAGELGLTTYAAGASPWSHSTALSTIDSKVSDLMHGKLRDAAVYSSLSSQPDLTASGRKGVGVLEISAATGTDLSNITNGTDEQFLFVYFTNASPPDVQHGTDADDISLHGGVDWTPSQYDWMCLWYDGDNSIWREVWRRSSSLFAATVNTSALSTTTQSGTLNNGGTTGFTGGTYSFAPQCYSATGAYGVFGGSSPGGLYNVSGLNGLAYTIRYIQSSPPYLVNGIEWGSFLYLHRDSSTGEVLSSSMAEDPHWYQGGASAYGKNDIRRIRQNVHPFSFFDDATKTFTKEPPSGTEIVLVDMRGIDLVESSFDLGRERAKMLRDQASEKARVGAPLDEILAMTSEASELEAKARPVPGKEFRLRDAKAFARGLTPWDLVKDAPEVKNASSQAKEGGKPIKFGDKDIDNKITIVTAG